MKLVEFQLSYADKKKLLLNPDQVVYATEAGEDSTFIKTTELHMEGFLVQGSVEEVKAKLSD